MSLSCTIFEILSLIFQNLKGSRDSEHIPFVYNSLYYACTSSLLLYINQHTKFEVPSFTIGATFKKGSRDPAQLRDSLSFEG